MNTQILTKANEIIRGANFTKIVKARKNAAMHHCVLSSQFFAIYISYTNDFVYAVDNNGNAFQLV
jgi:hypothetical protein